MTLETKSIKKIIALVLLLMLLGVLKMFCHYQLVYALPTPVPHNYKPVPFGSKIDLPTYILQNKKPLFLHFFNPDCSCSRFNISHFNSLVNKFGTEVTFLVIVIHNKKYTTQQIQQKFDIKATVMFDTSMASICGVYSTPQAVIIDNRKSLYYRGNYNRSRYCSDNKSNYAEQALTDLLNNKTQLTNFSTQAFTAYGCSLPNCNY